MIAVGHRFSSGAVTLGVIPADRDSVLVLARVCEGEYVIGRVHVSQLPHPEEWHNGDYFRSVEGAVKRWLERTGPWSGDDLLSATKHMTALIERIEKALNLKSEEELQRDKGTEAARNLWEHTEEVAEWAPDEGRLDRFLNSAHDFCTSGYWVAIATPSYRAGFTAEVEKVKQEVLHEPGTLGEFLHERRIPGVPCGHEEG